MCLAAVFILLWMGLMVNSERHSLTYIYTAFSKPVQLPGIHEFTAMGLLDNRMIDYFDSSIQKKVPKQSWMAERLDKEYWDKGTQSRQSKQQWFKVNIGILMKRMRQNDSDVHILQWMHGCEGDTQPDGSLAFRRGKDMYSYDGNDFVSFDDDHKVWVAPVEAAVETKRKWDGVPVLKDYTKGYLENECMQWLGNFMKYGEQQLKKASPPNIFLFAKDTMTETNVTVTCLVTGFYQKDLILQIKKDGCILTKDDGLLSSGYRPNEDDTWQRRDSVEILRTDMSTYTCEATHAESGVHVEKVLVLHLTPGGGNSVLVRTIVVTMDMVVVAVFALFYVRWKIANGLDNQNPRSADSVLYENVEDTVQSPIRVPESSMGCLKPKLK